MKNIRVLLPIIMAALMAFSCYSLISTSVDSYKEYKSYCDAAEKAAADKITVDVEDNYTKALEMKNSLELYLTWGKYYTDNSLFDSAASLGEVMVEEYPKSDKAYEYLLDNYLKINDYEKFFDSYKKAEKLGIINEGIKNLYNKSKYLYELDFNSYVAVSPFASGMSAVLVDNYDSENENKYGFANESGDLKIKDEYKYCGFFNSEELSVAPVIDGAGEAFYVDKEGNRKYVIKPEKIKVVSLGMYCSDVISVFDGSKYYMCDINSNVIAGPYDYLSTINGGIGVANQAGKWSIVDNKGNVISKKSFDGFILDEKEIAYRQDCLFAKSGNDYILIDKDGNQIGKEKFEDAKMFIDSYAAVKRNGLWGFVDKNGNVVIDYQFNDAKSFSNGLAGVSNGILWGYIYYDEESKATDIAINYSFKEVQPFSQTANCAFVRVDENWNLIKLYYQEQ